MTENLPDTNDGNIEYIRKEDAVDAVPKERIVEYMDEFGAGYNSCRNDMLRSIESITPADVVQVVRCRDCKHWQHGMIGMGCYWDADYPHEENDFCSRGERKE